VKSKLNCRDSFGGVEKDQKGGCGRGGVDLKRGEKGVGGVARLRSRDGASGEKQAERPWGAQSKEPVGTGATRRMVAGTEEIGEREWTVERRRRGSR